MNKKCEMQKLSHLESKEGLLAVFFIMFVRPSVDSTSPTNPDNNHFTNGSTNNLFANIWRQREIKRNHKHG